jgi:hypothetical protein
MNEWCALHIRGDGAPEAAHQVVKQSLYIICFRKTYRIITSFFCITIGLIEIIKPASSCFKDGILDSLHHSSRSYPMIKLPCLSNELTHSGR